MELVPVRVCASVIVIGSEKLPLAVTVGVIVKAYVVPEERANT